MPNIRKPNVLHTTSGTFRKDRHGEVGESLDDKDLGDLPPPPTFLSRTATVEWFRVVAILGPYKLLKGTDYGVLIAYCQLFEAISKMDPDDFKATVFTQFRGYCNDLGLTPVSRSKINLGKGENDKHDNPYSNL